MTATGSIHGIKARVASIGARYHVVLFTKDVKSPKRLVMLSSSSIEKISRCILSHCLCITAVPAAVMNDIWTKKASRALMLKIQAWGRRCPAWTSETCWPFNWEFMECWARAITSPQLNPPIINKGALQVRSLQRIPDRWKVWALVEMVVDVFNPNSSEALCWNGVFSGARVVIETSWLSAKTMTQPLDSWASWSSCRRDWSSAGCVHNIGLHVWPAGTLDSTEV